MLNRRVTMYWTLLCLLVDMVVFCSSLSLTYGREECIGTHKMCVSKYLCINGVFNTNDEKIFNAQTTVDALCGTLEVCCSLPPNKLKHEYITVNADNTLLGSNLTTTHTGEMAAISTISRNIRSAGELCNGAHRVCVQRHICANGVINTNGENLIDVRVDQNKVCGYLEVCCNLPPIKSNGIGNINNSFSENTSTKIPLDTSINTNNSSGGEKCTGDHRVCVDRYLCVNGVINTSGENLINVRIDTDNICGFLKVCCNLPSQSIKRNVTSTIDELLDSIFTKTPPIRPIDRVTTVPTVASNFNKNVTSAGETCNEVQKVCVSRHLCLNGVINTSGENHIDVRIGAEKRCDFLEVCCFLPMYHLNSTSATTTTTSPIKAIAGNSTVSSNYNESISGNREICMGAYKACVKRHLCVSGIVIANSTDLFSGAMNTSKTCSSLETCCNLPRDEVPSEPKKLQRGNDCSTPNGANVVMRIIGPTSFVNQSNMNLLTAKSRRCWRYGAPKPL